MRTLKKSISLVLALVMVLGLCMIGANATYANYTDNKEINYADAVEVLTGLNVIEGYPDGEFKPAENVTRAEAAAMITRMMLGRDKADKLPVGDVKFTDVPETNWAAKYIAFCANRGIIVGMGDGTFRPSDNITGTQMAVMLLRALGYGTMGEYEGKGWDINGVADALYHKVFEDTEVTDFSQPATREETALYVWNTMRRELVGYDVDLNYYRGKGTDFASDVFSLRKWAGGQVLENQATGNKYTVVKGIDVEYDEDGLEYFKTVTRKLDIETELDLIAHEVTVYYKVDKDYKDKENNRYWKAYLVQDNSTYLNVTAFSYLGDMYNELVANNKNNKTYPLDTVQTWFNYVYQNDKDTKTLADYTGCANANDMKGRYTLFDWLLMKGIDGDIILNSNGNPLAYRIYDYTVDQVKKISGNEITLKNDDFEYETYDLELAYDGIAKGDFVTVQPVGDLCYLYPTTTQEINVTQRAVGADTNKLPTFNNRAVSYGSGYDAVNVPNTDDVTTIYAGDKVLFYMDYYGYYFAAKVLERGTLKGVVFVNSAFKKTGSEDAYGESDESVYVQCVDEDGKEVIYQLNSDYTSTADAPQGVYRVYTDSKDLATLSPVGFETAKGSGMTSFVKYDSDNYYVTSDTKVFYVKGEKKAMKVTPSGALTKDACTVYANVNGKDLKTVWITDADAPTTSGSYIYVYPRYYDNTFDPANFLTLFTAKQYAQNDGSKLINETTTYYFTAYLDGVSQDTFIETSDLKWMEGDELWSLYKIEHPTYYVEGGFYTFSANEYEEGTVYDIEKLDATTTFKAVTVNLTSANLRDGKLYIEDVNSKADALKITNTVVNCANPTTADGNKYLTLNNIEDIEDFLWSNEGKNSITLTYLATKVNEDWVPTGALYITYGNEVDD